MRSSSPPPYGLGEAVVQGAVNPDEFYVYKPLSPPIGQQSSSEESAKRRSRWSTPAMPRSGGRPSSSTSSRPTGVVLSLTDAEVTELAQHAMTIERHYGRPMDIEWARDGRDGQLYILQARPETVKSRQAAGRVQRYR